MPPGKEQLPSFYYPNRIVEKKKSIKKKSMSLKDDLGTNSENYINLPYAMMSGITGKPEEMGNISLKN